MHISLRFSFSLLMALGSLVIVNSDDRSSRSPSTCTFEDIFVSRSGYEVNIFNAQRCKIIDLSGENIGELGIAELSKCSLAHLEIFDLTRNKLGENGGSYLSTILKNASKLTSLAVWGNYLNPQGAIHIIKALNTSGLTHLYMGGNNVQNTGVEVLADALASGSKLEVLHLNGNNIDDTGVVDLADALSRNSMLKELDLQWNRLGERGAAALVTALLQNTVMETLLLGGPEPFKRDAEMCSQNRGMCVV